MAKGEDCTVGAQHEEAIRGIRDTCEANWKDHDRMWDAIDKLRNRLPLWATLVFGLLASSVTGLLVAMARGG